MADPWARWLLHDRFGGNEELYRQALARLEPIRERVLEAASLKSGDVLLDVGTGDGLIGFGALAILGEGGTVLFSDISEELLQRCREVAAQLGVEGRCGFVRAAAEDLSPIEDASVDVVTTRSVLIYVKDKVQAFREFHRVLRSGGRISLFEPINRAMAALNRGTLFGYEAGPVGDLVDKVVAVYERAHPPDSPMMDFDERDLLRFAEEAGFEPVRVTLEIEASTNPRQGVTSWDTLLEVKPNPLAPSYREAIAEALAPEEVKRLEEHLSPLVERGQAKVRHAFAYVRAVKM